MNGSITISPEDSFFSKPFTNGCPQQTLWLQLQLSRQYSSHQTNRKYANNYQSNLVSLKNLLSVKQETKKPIANVPTLPIRGVVVRSDGCALLLRHYSNCCKFTQTRRPASRKDLIKGPCV